MNERRSIQGSSSSLGPRAKLCKHGNCQDGQTSSTYAIPHLVDDKKKRKKARKDLLAYCKLDTLTMVRTLDRLREKLKPN